ncbi:hypothetical protein D1872_194090 [compost metagenome]
MSSLIGVIVGVILNQISVLIFSRRAERERILMANMSSRLSAYSNIYSALLDYQLYYSQFVDYGNEFIVHEDPKDFAPLSSLEELTKAYNKNEIWIHESSKAKISEVLQLSSYCVNLAIWIQDPNNIDMINEVEKKANSMLKLIEDAKNHIIKVNGLEKLDQHSQKLLK